MVDCCNRVSSAVIGAAIEVHRHLGAGLLESAYEDCLEWELKLRGYDVQRQVMLPIEYKGLLVKRAFRLDLLVENIIIVEMKAEPRIEPIFETQLNTYLRLSNLYLGLILNFQAARLKEGGIKRVINPHAANNLEQVKHLL
ncbi:GxxExxY protein [bacterium]|nr:MAG: GxxExxY protein [bacterium]